jgi:predicted NAD/FAD-binding protein
MKIAVIGGGVAGLGAAYGLKDAHDVTLYEKDARLGGHANTVTIDYDGVSIEVDTGFIVFNQLNYPNLLGLFADLGVDSRLTDMSFACAGGGMEWSSNFPRGVFAQKRNLVSPSFLRMLHEIGRFNTTARTDLAMTALEGVTLGAYLRLRGFHDTFRDRYLLPMGAAIWSTTEGQMADVPAETFLRFFANHGLLNVKQPIWSTVVGGSRTYVSKLQTLLGGRIRAGTGVVSVNRTALGVEVRDTFGELERYDHVIFASHSDQALAALSDADPEERAFLGAIRYASNQAILHRDPNLMPKRRAAWGSWNYVTDLKPEIPPYVTYWMNSLQHIDETKPLFVSLNGPEPDPALIFGRFDYEHPQFDGAALAAQRRFSRIQGRGGVWYAGAWLGYGFHEDGLTSGLRVALALGGSVPWKFVDHRIEGGPLAPPAVHSAHQWERLSA